VFVLVEHPLPWPSDLADDPRLAEVQRVAERAAPDRTVRLQAVVPEPSARVRRVIAFIASADPFRGYGRVESTAAPEALSEVVAELVGSTPPPVQTGIVSDVLICTHGSRDSCCGSLGTRLWLEQDRAEVRVWRTSHTGGHRFAPTAITFPDGNYWARLDADSLAGIVDRTLDPVVAAAHLRGCAAFSPVGQVADRAALATRGWPWLDVARFVEERSPSLVELCFESAAGERGGFVVRVESVRTVPVPDCGADPADATKHQTELRVIGVDTSS
jgi:hypothetical protein